VVADVSLTVTSCPPDVDIVKPDVVRLLTVPTDPPEDGADRALEAPPAPKPPAAPLADAAGAAAVGEAVVEGELARPAATPVPDSASAAAPATTHRRRAFESRPRRAGWVGWGLVGSYSFMMALLLLR
jgi:hypothetical protein